MTVTADEISFVESNVWLHALMGQQNPQKYRIAEPLTKLPKIIISVQVVNEVSVNLIKKAKLSEDQIQKIIVSFYLDFDLKIK